MTRNVFVDLMTAHRQHHKQLGLVVGASRDPSVREAIEVALHPLDAGRLGDALAHTPGADCSFVELPAVVRRVAESITPVAGQPFSHCTDSASCLQLSPLEKQLYLGVIACDAVVLALAPIVVADDFRVASDGFRVAREAVSHRIEQWHWLAELHEASLNPLPS